MRKKRLFFQVVKNIWETLFVDIPGTCGMGNHVHLVLRFYPGDRFFDEEIRRRYQAVYGDDRENRVEFYRAKWASLSEFMKEL